MRSRIIALIAAAAGVAVAACAGPVAPATGSTAPSATGPVPALGGHPHPLLADAIARGRDLGPLPGSTPLTVVLGLEGRDPRGLADALASGKRFTPAEYAARFGPDPAAVTRIESLLAGAGIAAHQTGAATLTATGSAAGFERLLGLTIDRHVGPDGTRFYAPASAVSLPAALRPTVNGITGLDDYPSVSVAAIRGQNGVTPADMMDFYNVNPLRKAGLDGAGMTVVFLEIDRFDQAMLDAFAKKYSLPAFNVEVKPSLPSWGQPTKEQGEADLDLEIVHAIAPAAKEVVYYMSPQAGFSAEPQMYKDFPSGAIESKSLGQCERPELKNYATNLNDASTAAAATGWSIFTSSGDSGAFGCTPAGDPNSLAINVDSGPASVTSIGGTYALLGAAGGYYREAAWGEPIEQSGSGGGLSMFWPLPSWQKGPGVSNQYSNGKRQNPDISANGDGESGWDVFALGQELPIGGTSAAAPFIAACIALIDQDLKRKNLPLVGFANPALYYFAQNPPGLPAPPYHDITLNTNLYYPATSGWDYATGLGTPDVAALADDFEWYATHKPGG